jgi:hypothetical protein
MSNNLQIKKYGAAEKSEEGKVDFSVHLFISSCFDYWNYGQSRKSFPMTDYEEKRRFLLPSTHNNMAIAPANIARGRIVGCR